MQVRLEAVRSAGIVAEARSSRVAAKAGIRFTSLDAGSAPVVADYVARGRNRDDEIDQAEADARRR